MNTLLFVAALMVLPAPVSTPERGFTSERVAMYSAAVLDIVTTELALRDGGKEANPIFGKQPKLRTLVAAKVGSVALTEFAANYLRKKGYIGRARTLYWFSAALWGFAGSMNLRYVW